MSAEVDLTFELTSFDAATSALCALRALVWILSVVLAVTVAERALDIGRDRLDLAGGVGRGRRQRALRLARAVQDRSGGVRADRRQGAFDIDRQRLDVIGGFRGSGRPAWLCASRAPAVIDSAVAVPAHRQRTLHVGGQRLDLVGGIRGGGHQRGLGLARAGERSTRRWRCRPSTASAGHRRQRLDLVAASAEAVTSVVWASRAPATMDRRSRCRRPRASARRRRTAT